MLVFPLLLAVVSVAVPASPGSRALTFEQRVAAQRAIEQVYYRHQEGATLPFDEAVPRDLLEAKVRDYLLESAALEQRWGRPITEQLLNEEALRIARSTRMPDRVTGIYAAPGSGRVRILEGLARPALAARLARQSLASDPEAQSVPREEAIALRERLRDGRLSPDEEHPRRVVIDSGDDR